MTPTDRRRMTGLTGGVVAASLASLAAFFLMGSLIAFGVLAGGLLITGIVMACGVRATAIAVSLFFVLPSAVGEGSLVRSLAAMALILLLVVTARVEVGEQNTSRAPALALLILAVTMVGTGTAPIEFGGLYVAAAIAVYWIGERPGLAIGVLRALTVVIGCLTVSYLVTWAVGFNTVVTALTFGDRVINVHAPFALTGFGTRLWEGAPPRLLLLTGEPGLNSFFIIPALALVVTQAAGRLRLAVLAVLAAAAVMSQSAGVLIALAAGAGAALVVWLGRRGNLLTALVLGAGGAASTFVLANRLVAARAGGNAETVTDRGLAFGSSSSASLGNINLVTTLERDLLLGLGIAAAVALMGLAARRSSAAIFAWAAFFVTALFAQPSQWQVGAWLLLALVILLPQRSSRLPEDDDRDLLTVGGAYREAGRQGKCTAHGPRVVAPIE